MKERLTFSSFKDWAFLTVSVALVGMLVKSIEKLDSSVQSLSQKFSDTSGTILVMRRDVDVLEVKVDRLEQRHPR